MTLYRPSLRAQLLLALVVPAALVLWGVARRAEALSRGALEAALEERLISVAHAGAAILSSRVTVLGPGDDDTRTKRNALGKLQGLRDATRVARLLVVRASTDEVILDTDERLPIGAPFRRAEFDRLELETIRAGEGAASILFEGPSGRPFKTGYAPLSQSEEVVAYVAAVAPATYTDALTALNERLLTVGLLGLVFLVASALIVANWIATPLRRLSASAESIGAGHLDTPIPHGGPREAEVLAETMAKMCRSLKAREEEMQMMLAGIAHEVRNPLGGIELFGGLLREDLEETDPRRDHVEKILRELHLLSRVVTDFLEFARRRPLEPKSVDLSDFFFQLVSLAEAQAQEENIGLRVAPAAAPIAHFDEEAVQRAVVNLIRNAIQAANERVEVSSHVSDHVLEIKVEDDGPGVPEEVREKIFAPFFTTKQKGTGLGLALVQQTALAHRGAIRVETTEGGGARFVLRLPQAVSPSGTAAKEHDGKAPGH